jgi:hypothetical protein
MHIETKVPELNYNEIQFTQNTENDTTPLQQLLVCKSRLRKTQSMWLRNVILAPQYLDSPLADVNSSGFMWEPPALDTRMPLRWLVAFCEQNSKVNIKLLDPHFCLSPSFLAHAPFLGTTLAFILRRKALGPLSLDIQFAQDARIEIATKMARYPRTWSACKKFGAAPNLRIFPTVFGCLKFWQHTPYGCRPEDMEDLHDCTKQRLEWIENGI